MTHQTTRVGKQHLLKVAEQLFTDNGYQAVSIRDIAHAGGVTNAALYYYFPNKEALFSEVLTFHVTRLGKCLKIAGESKTHPRERVIQMLFAYCKHGAQSRSPLFLMRFISDKIDQDEIKDQHTQLLETLLYPIECELKSAIDSGNLQSLPDRISAASLLLGLLHGLIQHRRLYPDSEITLEDVEWVVDIFWRGMSKQE